jgi:predicted phage-related endonuclease
MRNRYIINKPPHGSQAWLDVRWENEKGEKRVTASVAAAVHGEHKYTTMADLAVELLAQDPPEPKEQNDAMRRGTILEEPLLRWAGEILGVTITEPKELYCYEEDGVRLLATIDGFDGEKIYELKTYNKRWQGQLPRYWYWQGVQQAICCDVDAIHWIVFDSDLQLHFYTQTVTSDERQAHIDKVREFLSFIDVGMMPEGADPTYDNAVTMYPEGYENTVVLDHSVMDSLERLALAREQKKQAEAVEEQIKGEIAMMLQDCEYGSIDGTTVVSWKNSERTSFDSKKFQAEHPALFDKFKKTSRFRTMRIIAKEAK